MDYSSSDWSKILELNSKNLSALFDNMIDGFAFHKILTDANGKPIDYIFLETNKVFEKMTGLKKKNIIGKKVTEILKGIENDPADWIGRYGKVALTGEPAQFENYAAPLEKWYKVSAYSPQKSYFVAIFEDITERKNAETELKKVKENWETTFDAVPDYIALIDTNYHIVRANASMAKQLGVTPDQAVNSICYECIHATHGPPENCPHAKLMKDGKEHVAEVYEPRLGGYFLVSATPIRDTNGKLTGSVHVARDITERKKVEDALRKLTQTLEERVHKETLNVENERQRLYNVLETLPPYIVLLDKNYQVVFANKVFRDLFGESKGLPCYKFLFQKDSPCENCETYKVLQTTNPQHWQWTGPNGRDYDIYDYPFADQDGSTLILEMGLDVTERKHAEAELQKYHGHLEQLVAERTAALRESEQRWATTLSSIGDAVIATDINGRITFMNAVAEQLTGWDLHTIEGEPIEKVFNIINQNSRTKVVSPVNKVLEQGLTVGLANHTLLIRKDGIEVPIDDSGAPIVNDDGKITGVVLVFRDIANRRKTEDALLRQAALIDLSPDAIIVRKFDGTITFWSKGAESIYGWTQKEAVGKMTHELLQTTFPVTFEEIVSQLKTSKGWTGEVSQKTKTGRKVIMQSCWRAEKTEHGEIESILESNVDITERKNAEQEIERLASFPELNPNPVIEINLKGSLTYINPATYRLFPGIKQKGSSHYFFEDLEKILQNFRENNNFTSYTREIKLNGHWYQQQFYLVPNQRLIRLYLTDIDELKQIEEARAQTQVKLEEYACQMEELAEQRAQQLQNAERLAAIGQTAGMVGHDIRNPLQAITSDMYIISEEAKTLKDKQTQQDIMESVDSINKNLAYINKIVSDLQDFTKPLQPNLQVLHLDDLISNILSSICLPPSIQVTTNIYDEARKIFTDSAYIRRILTNLLTNAIQAMPTQGSLVIVATKENGALILSVKDTGEGISEEAKAKMFTPLFTTKSKGQGLGLAVVKRLVESLNGTITFESETGKGTKFIVTLPQKPMP